MARALILAVFICVCGILCSSRAEARIVGSSPSRTTTTTKPTPTTSSEEDSNSVEENERYHPAEINNPRVLEESNLRYLDGNYEYRYALSNGVTRYEKSYWTPLANGTKVLAHKGFFSHPLSNNKYITVFYTADDTGYHQDSSKFTKKAPILPRHLEVPELEFPIETTRPTPATTTTTTRTTTTTTTRKPRTTTTRKPKTTRKTRTTTEKSVKKPSEFNWIY